MERYILKNNVKLIYEQREGNLTSFCIGFEAGANMEEGYPYGTAHAVEHMLFKGTKKRTEYEINKTCDEIFGFNNAMTNYPYCIYYGTTLSSDFERGFELYSDILLNPTFPEKGFKEEMDIICEELKDWKDDLVQACEDELFANSFKSRRIKELIIGNEASIGSIDLKTLKSFYSEFYAPGNCTVTVVSSLSKEDVVNMVEKYLMNWERGYSPKNIKLYEENKAGLYIEERKDINGAKLQYIYTIHELSERELKALSIFNLYFGEGTSSLLFDEIRTRRGLAYDVSSLIKYEKGIKLYVIALAVSKENIAKALSVIDEIVLNAKKDEDFFTYDIIQKYAKIIKLKREMKFEKSVELCKNLAVYEIMYNKAEKFYSEVEDLVDISQREIIEVVNKVLVNPSIQIIQPS